MVRMAAANTARVVAVHMGRTAAVRQEATATTSRVRGTTHHVECCILSDKTAAHFNQRGGCVVTMTVPKGLTDCKFHLLHEFQGQPRPQIAAGSVVAQNDSKTKAEVWLPKVRLCVR